MLILLIFRLILITFGTFVLGYNDICVTINQENGKCMSLQDCGLTIEILLASSEAYYFAKESKCGSSISMVCCGPSGYQNTKPITSTASSQEEKIRLSIFSDSSVCGIQAYSNRIKGGVTTEFEEFPWLAGLEYVSNYDHENKGIRCGGSLINQRFVLTAAHCVAHHELVLVKVWLGATNISSDGKNCLKFAGANSCIDSIQKYNVAATFPNSLYNRMTNTNDIGLIKLEHPVEFSDFVRPICLPSPNSPPLSIQSYVTVAGWGATENSSTSNIKLKVDVPIKNESDCNKFLNWRNHTINSEQLCVGGEPGKDSCQGDSGGPLMKSYINENGDTQWVQVGIVSYGVGCGIRNRPGVYVKVSAYIAWIVQNILERGSPCTTPNDEAGSCIPARSCKVIVDAIETGSSTALKFAKQSQCGYDSETLLCCGSTGYPSTVLPSYSDTVTKPPVQANPNENTKEEIERMILEGFNTKTLPDRNICGLETKETRISNREVAEIGDFPWMAALEYIFKGSGQPAGLRCGGTLINNRFVLTAAHCIISRELHLTKVWLGEWQISKDPDCQKLESADKVQKLEIKEEIPHPFYNSVQGSNDIALLKLEQDIKYTNFIRPICLPPVSQPVPACGSNFMLAGWGATKNGTLSDIKLKVILPLISNMDCKRSRTISANQLCVGGVHGTDSCKGDSGGPLMGIYTNRNNQQAQWYQEGVVSYNFGCDPIRPVIYTRVNRYITWILNYISGD